MTEEIFSDHISVGSWGGATQMTTQTIALVSQPAAGGYICPKHYDEYKIVYKSPSDGCVHCEMEFQQSRMDLKERRAVVSERLKELSSKSGSNGHAGVSGAGNMNEISSGQESDLYPNMSMSMQAQQWKPPRGSPENSNRKNLDVITGESNLQGGGNMQQQMGTSSLGRSTSISSTAGSGAQHYNSEQIMHQNPMISNGMMVQPSNQGQMMVTHNNTSSNNFIQSNNVGTMQTNSMMMPPPQPMQHQISNQSGQMSHQLQQQPQQFQSQQQQQHAQSTLSHHGIIFEGNNNNSNLGHPHENADAGNGIQRQSQLNQQQLEQKWLTQTSQQSQLPVGYNSNGPNVSTNMSHMAGTNHHGWENNGLNGTNNSNTTQVHGNSMNMNNLMTGMNNLNMNGSTGMNNSHMYHRGLGSPSGMSMPQMYNNSGNQQSSPNNNPNNNMFSMQQQQAQPNIMQPYSMMSTNNNPMQFDPLTLQIQRMQQMQDWMLLQKEQECTELKSKLEQALELQQQLRVENALLTEKLHQQEQRMQQELKLIKLAAVQRQQQQKQQEKQKKLTAQRQLQEQRMLVLASSANHHIEDNFVQLRRSSGNRSRSSSKSSNVYSDMIGGMPTEEVVDGVEEERSSQGTDDRTPLRLQDGSVYSNEQPSVLSEDKRILSALEDDNDPLYPPTDEDEGGNDPGEDTDHSGNEDEDDEEDQWPSVRNPKLTESSESKSNNIADDANTAGDEWLANSNENRRQVAETFLTSSSATNHHSLTTPFPASSGSIHSGSTNGTENVSKQIDDQLIYRGSQNISGSSMLDGDIPFNTNSSTFEKRSHNDQGVDAKSNSQLHTAKGSQYFSSTSSQGNKDTAQALNGDNVDPSFTLRETATIGTSKAAPSESSNTQAGPVSINSSELHSMANNDTKSSPINKNATISRMMNNIPKAPTASSKDNPIVVEDASDTWSYVADEKKTSASFTSNHTHLPPKPPQSLLGSSNGKGVSWTDDSASMGQSVASSTFGEDRVKVTNAQILDPYGDQGLYTGVILRSTGMPHGSGRMVYAEDKRTYDGEWRHGRWHGFGRATFANGDCYAGEYRFDQRHGRGKYEWHDGRVYDGMFKEDKRHGRGKFLWPDGAAYEGEFRNGQREGQGTYTFSDGGKYEGSWKDGRYSGFGICSWEDGRCYKGEWLNGMAHGKGIETFPDGAVRHDGMWIEDDPVLQ